MYEKGLYLNEFNKVLSVSVITKIRKCKTWIERYLIGFSVYFKCMSVDWT